MEFGSDSAMTALRYLIVYLVLSAFAVRPAYAERLKINYVFPPDRPVAAAKLHPVAKGGVDWRRRGHALLLPYTRAERAALAAMGRRTPGSPLRTVANQLIVRRLNLARIPQPARAFSRRCRQRSYGPRHACPRRPPVGESTGFVSFVES